MRASLWMNGPRSGIVPDDVESDIGTFYRNLFRLEKTFSEVPLAHQMASDVRCMLEDASFFVCRVI